MSSTRVHVKIHEKESFEKGLRRFIKSVEKSGILTELRKHEYYEKPSVKSKRARAQAIKRTKKAQSELNNRGKRLY